MSLMARASTIAARTCGGTGRDARFLIAVAAGVNRAGLWQAR